MEYRYRLTEKEAKEAFAYTWTERLWWVYLFFAIAMISIGNSGVTGLLVALLSVVIFGYTQVKSFRKQFEKWKSQLSEGCFCIENGCIVTMGRLGWSCFSCGDVLKIARRGQNHWIKVSLPGQKRSWIVYMLPFRVTGDRQAQQAFVQELRKQRKEMQHMTPDEVQQRVLDVKLRLEQQSWGDVEADYTVDYVWEEQEFKRFRGQLQKALGLENVVLPYVGYRSAETAAWKIRFTNEAVLLNCYLSSFCRPWESLKTLIETSELFVLFAEDGAIGAFFPKAVIEHEADRQEFREYCEKHGLEYSTDLLAVEGSQERKRKSTSKRLRRYLTFVATVVIVARVITTMIAYKIDDYSSTELAQDETEYVFHPEDYPDYLPLEKQISVLESLGFQITPRVVESLEESMEEWPESREWIEGWPYYSLLGEIGYPEWDTETWEIVGYSNQAYWFDWEGYDLSTDYIEILNGVSALAGDDFTLTNPAENTDRVDWDKWTGVIEVSFLLNDTPYRYEVEMEGDWLDINIVKYINDALEQEQVPGHVYAMEDNGQGCVLFYRDEEWAKEFEKKTGIPLATEYQ